MRTVIFLSLFSISVLLAQAQAGYLTIEGTPKIQIGVLGDRLSVAGAFRIENHGNETAKEVFPTLELGQWRWAGEPQQLEASGNHEWSVEALIPVEKVRCRKEGSCSESSRPLNGVFPVLVRRHYQDLNSYPFSSSEVLLVKIGEISPEQSTAIRVPDIQSRVEIHGYDPRYEGTLKLRNSSEKSISAHISLFTSKELEPNQPVFNAELAPHSAKEVPFQIENFGALVGSTYAVHAIAEWEEQGIRVVSTSAGMLKVMKVDRLPWIIAGICAVALALSAVLLLAMRGKLNLNRAR